MGNFLGLRYQKADGEKEKLRQKKADRRKKMKLGDMKTPTFLVGVFLAYFNYKIVENWDFDQKLPTSWGLPPSIYMYN